MKSKNRNTRLKRFINDIFIHTPFFTMLYSLIILWVLFSGGVYFAEREMEGATITSFGDALYWGVAAFSTAGIADTPQSSWAKLIGGIWIIIGSGLFFGTIVATITTYFMRPMQRPVKRIIDTIEYNLEQLDNLTIEELDLLRETVDTLIEHVEKIKGKETKE
ncbi:MAG: ion channel [Nitrospinae bacterium]|nr:ion channel [Nitrospinota bacterium]MDA1108724.1 ion channel [Nitrospinota bacterium]